MKRDWECVRAILLALEDKPDAHSVLHPRDISGWDEQAVSYHMQLLDQAGLIVATCKEVRGTPVFCLAYRLTWEGHELLDRLKSETLWNRIRAAARERSIELSFEAIKFFARKALESMG